MLKTASFIEGIKKDINQFKLTDETTFTLKGSSTYLNYISDVDFNIYVDFDDKLVERLRTKFSSDDLKNFKLLYLKAGIRKEFDPVWKIDGEEECHFDLKESINWFNNFKKKDLMNDKNAINYIESIFNRDKLRMPDIVEISEILWREGALRWEKDDIITGKIEKNGVTYKLMDVIEDYRGRAVFNCLYIKGEDIVLVDIGIQQRQSKRLNQYYRKRKYYVKNYYKILKEMKRYRFLSKYMRDEYFDDLKTMGYQNSVLGRSSVLDLLLKRKDIDPGYTDIVSRQLTKGLQQLKIPSTSLSEIQKIINGNLQAISKGLIQKHYDRLDNNGKKEMYPLLWLMKQSQLYTNKKEIIIRNKKGNNCPFFYSKGDELSMNVTSRLLYKPYKLKECAEKHKKLPLYQFMQLLTCGMPIERLFLEKGSDAETGRKMLCVRGIFTEDDRNFLNSIGVYDNGRYHSIKLNELQNLRYYLLTGKNKSA